MGKVLFTDDEIAAMLQVPKRLSADFEIRLRPKRSNSAVKQLQGAIDVPGDDGQTYRIVVRCVAGAPDCFSVILCVSGVPTHDGVFRLRRYNGHDHQHTNELEGNTIAFEYHLHTATERYQDHIPDRPDWYAVPRSGFESYWDALQVMLDECGFILPKDAQLTLREVDEP